MTWLENVGYVPHFEDIQIQVHSPSGPIQVHNRLPEFSAAEVSSVALCPTF